MAFDHRVGSEKLTEEFDETVATQFLSMFIESAVRDGRLSINELSQDEANAEIRRYLDQTIDRLDQGEEILWVTDHKERLLSHAKRYHNDGMDKMAVLLCATWLEHWLNGILVSLARRLSIPENEISQLLRSCSFRDKSTWLLRLLHMPQLEDNYRKTIQLIFDERNAFVHYKWRAKNEEVANQEEQRISVALDDIDETVAYLKKYEKQHLYPSTLTTYLKGVHR